MRYRFTNSPFERMIPAFILPFFTPALRLVLANAASLVSAKIGENSLIPLLRLSPPKPPIRLENPC